MKRLITLCAGLAVLLSANGARADLSAIGEAAETGSWSQQFVENGVGSFNFIAVRMTSSGDSFEAPTFYTFNKSGWAIGYQNDASFPTIANATGTTQTELYFYQKFAGAKADALQFDFVSFDQDLLKDAARAVWNGSGWSFTVLTASTRGTDGKGIDGWQRSDFEAVPVPAAVLLGMLGLGAAGVRLRKSA